MGGGILWETTCLELRESIEIDSKLIDGKG
jgi:hypothetical protein